MGKYNGSIFQNKNASKYSSVRNIKNAQRCERIQTTTIIVKHFSMSTENIYSKLSMD